MAPRNPLTYGSYKNRVLVNRTGRAGESITRGLGGFDGKASSFAFHSSRNLPYRSHPRLLPTHRNQPPPPIQRLFVHPSLPLRDPRRACADKGTFHHETRIT
jgi:hypothetical protein